ncbi:MAG: sigma 54-interacting transcriptional regulator [Myxococcales bacterium]|nr:sigma 54-interacting transcriptional regulator [Myxococcales bacterium]
MTDAAQADGVVIEVTTGERAGTRCAATPPCTIGRAADATLTLPDAHLSTNHGRIERDGDTYRYVDRGSSNGSVHVRDGVATPLRGDCLDAELWDGDELHLGDPAEPVILRVHLAEDEEGAVVAMRPIAEVERFADRITAEPGRLGVLYRHGAALGASTDLDTVLSVAAELVFELLPQATHLAVALKERAGRFPVVYASRRDGAPTDIPVSRTLIKRVLEARAGVLLTNAASEMSSARSVVQAGLASTLTVPLWTGADIRGVLHVDNRDATGVFAADDLEVLTVAAGHISFAAENARLVARLRLAEQRLERENRYLKEREQEEKFPGIIGQSRGIAQVLEAVGKVRDTRVPVLIQGETGTGKELVARALHYTSQRADHLFVAQNCSALPENLLESELFGHMRGAFTGADRDKKGLFELADRGTIFLDEIAEMPVQLQAKLLRVLQEGEIWPLGAPRPKRVDVRVVSATHQDLEAMVKAGTFRQDLFYRLHVFPIRLPPLRERRDDIGVLARHFLARYGKEFGRPTNGFTPEALARLKAYHWPGNVRELQNELQRVLIQRTEGDLVLVEDLSPRILGETSLVDDPRVPRGTLKEMMDAVERVLLARALREHDNNKTRAAETLGITREGLHKKLGRFGMNT